MIPVWVESAVSAFGGRMGLNDLRLNDAGVASLTFENGMNLAFEFVSDSLCVMLKVPARPSTVTIRKLLVAAHPSNRFPFHLRTAYLAKRDMAMFMVRLGERQVTPTSLESVFAGLWEIAIKLGGDR